MGNNKHTPHMGTFVGRATLPFNVTAYSRPSMVYNIFIQDEIASSEDFLDAITVLNMANEDDTVVIHLNSPGGSIDAVDTFLMEMASCRARVVVKASGTVASAATLILLSASEFVMSPYTNILFHSASFGIGGKVQDVYEYAGFIKSQTEAMLRDYYKDFFSEQELEDIFVRKKEWWMTADEFTSRYEAMQEKRAAEGEEGEEISLQAIRDMLTDAVEESGKKKSKPRKPKQDKALKEAEEIS